MNNIAIQNHADFTKSYKKASLVKRFYPKPEYKIKGWIVEILKITCGKISGHYINGFEKLILEKKILNEGMEIEDIIQFEMDNINVVSETI